MMNLADRFCWYEADHQNKEGTSEEKYQRIVDWAGHARGTNPNAFDEVTKWLLEGGEWEGAELAENEKYFREEILGRFLYTCP